MHVALVLMTGNPNFAGGVPYVVYERAKYLRRHGHDVSIVCSSEPGWTQPESRDGIYIYPIKPPIGRVDHWFSKIATRSPQFLAALGKGLEAAHGRQPIDVVDLNDGPAILGTLKFCRRHRVPMTFTIHGSAKINPAPRPWLGRRLHVAYEKVAWRRADLVLPVSRYIAGVGDHYGDYARKVRVIPNTLDEAWLEVGRTRPPRVAGPLRALFVGRLDPVKRWADALEAMARLEPEQAHLDILGDGPDGDAARARAQELNLSDRVTFHGFVTDRDRVREMYRQAGVFVFPTMFEAMPIALLEAMAAGVVPIASDIPPNAEVLEGRHMVPYGDVAALAERLAELARDPGQIQQAQPWLQSRAATFTIDAVYPELIAAYEEAIRMRGR